jgi:hypothetical protein
MGVDRRVPLWTGILDLPRQLFTTENMLLMCLFYMGFERFPVIYSHALKSAGWQLQIFS